MNQQAYFTSMGVWGDKKWEATWSNTDQGFFSGSSKHKAKN